MAVLFEEAGGTVKLAVSRPTPPQVLDSEVSSVQGTRACEVTVWTVTAVSTTKWLSGACRSSMEMFHLFKVVAGGGDEAKDQSLPEVEFNLAGPTTLAKVRLLTKVSAATLQLTLAIEHLGAAEVLFSSRPMIMVRFACKVKGTSMLDPDRVYCRSGPCVRVHASKM